MKQHRTRLLTAGLSLVLLASLPSLAYANEGLDEQNNEDGALSLTVAGGNSETLGVEVDDESQQDDATKQSEGVYTSDDQDVPANEAPSLDEGQGNDTGNEGAVEGSASDDVNLDTAGGNATDANAANDAMQVSDAVDDQSNSTNATDTAADGGLAMVAESDDNLLQAEATPAPRQGHWVVDKRSGKLERYWIWSDDGSTAKDVTITPENGAEYYARALSDGRILRGKWDNGRGRVFIADNDGRLIGSDMTSDGWVVTSLYDGGMQRYYVDATTKAACSGFFTVPGYGDVFGAGHQGVIVRGEFHFGDRLWSADNDGKLRSGWVVTSSFGHGLQRYWMGDTVFNSPHAAAVSRLITNKNDHSGYDAYATENGTILRGRWDNGRGRVYIADNNGQLIGSGMETSGWVVTDKYDGHLERYYVDAATKAACSGFFNVPGYGDVFGLGGSGRIHRGVLRFGNSIILADNDGRLPSGYGFVVTDKYGQGYQRYWIEDIYQKFKGVKPGYSASGYSHYTTDHGYVLRGKQRMNNGMILANDDGLLAWKLGWLITDAYSKNTERYYIDESVGNGMHGAHVGLFTVNGKRYYGREDTGYVVRGTYVVSRYYGDSANAHGDVWHDDVVVIANNDGVLMSREEFGKQIVKIARSQIGTSYTTEDNAYYPNVAFNCSGLTYWVYSQAGVHLPHNQGYYSYYAGQNNTANSQMWGVEKRGGWKTSTSSMTAGDLVFFSPVGDKYHTGHVGIYIGNGQMIDCTPPGGTLVRNVSDTAGFVGGGFPITLI